MKLPFLEGLPKEKIQQLILAVIGCLIALGVVYQFYIARQRSALRELDGKVARLQQEIEDLQRQATRAAINDGARQRINAVVDEQTALMIDGDPFAWVVRSVTLLGQDQPVRILNWRPGQRAKHSRLSHHEVFATRLDIEARYDAIGQFVALLESHFPTGEIRLLEINGGKEGVHTAGIELSLLIRPATPKEHAAEPKKET